MAAESFNAAMAQIRGHEGGYVNHPADPGGPTNMGITLATYRQYIDPNGTATDIRNLTWGQALLIYRKRYADPINFDRLPVGLDYAVLDYAVNSGIGRAPKVLQALLGVKQDGVIGPVTLAALATRDTAEVIQALCDERLRFLRRLKTWPTFGSGWTKRVTSVRTVALQWARQAATDRAPAASPTPTTPAPGKAMVQPSASGKTASTGGGAAATVETARQAAESGADWVAIAAIVAAGLVLTGCAWLYWNHRARKTQETPIEVTPLPIAA